jgi:enamine deaminase RidA (YjgF/YER057c/UK114 family)
VFVSGTTARPPHLDGDAYQQMIGAIETITGALCEVGAQLRHVVRTVVYVFDMADIPHIARAHQETFGAFRPGATLVQVTALTPASGHRN